VGFVSKYSLQYLPQFEQDVAAIRDYIALVLKNPEAAICKRLENPTAFEPYISNKERKYPYYRIYVKNYIVFYVVINNIMEVRRFIYNKRDIGKLI
jgi:hypothetical protein